jgi:hypothetical protein
MSAPFAVGLHYDVPNDVYHRGLLSDPKPLSSSMAKTIVTKSPAEFRWEQDHRVERSAFDEGQAVHELVLEGGFKSIDVLDFDSWRTKDAKTARDESYAAQRHPILAADILPLQFMADAVAASRRASDVFTKGKPEVSALVFDEEHGVHLQARMDWLQLPEWGAARPVIADLKTSVKGANPRSFNREIAERRYHLSMAFYRRVLMLLGYDDPQLVFVVVDKAAPHLVSVHEMSVSDRIVGDLLVNKAIATYAACLAADNWPGYDTQIHHTDLPAWATYEAEEIAGPIYEGV